jgi:hypothetical protein
MNCKYWPTDDEVKQGICSGVCWTGSEISGSPCKKADELICDSALDYEKAMKIIQEDKQK